MIDEIQARLDQYHEWLRDRTALRDVGDWVEITTPYLDRHNDCVQIYVRRRNDTYELTDDSWTIQDLEASGVNLDTPKRRSLLEVTLNGFGVQRDGDALVVHATPDDFARRKHSLVQAMLGVNDLFALASPVVASVFWEDVRAWLDVHEIRYSERIPLVGRSGFMHQFDFVIPRSRTAPERVLRAINKPDRSHAEALLFGWIDSRDVRPEGSRAYAILNDEERAIPTSVTDPLAAYDIRAVPWSHRDEVVEELAA